MNKEKIVKVGYIVVIILIILSILMLYDTLSVFKIDRFALYTGAFINVPLGVLLVGLSLLVKWKSDDRSAKRNYVLGAGIVLGILTAILSPVLFLVTG